MTTLLNEKENEMIRLGYIHMLDNGYSKIRTMDDVLRFIAAQAAFAKREQRIANIEHCNEELPKAHRDAIIGLAELLEERLER